MKPIAAIILGAGSSRRMGNDFKPLLPFGGHTVLEHVCETYRVAGISDIRVVCGFRAGDVRSVLENHPVHVIENPVYKNGMLSSVKAGIETLDKDTAGFFIHPADIPLVRPATIKTLAAAFQNSLDGILFPVFMRRKGHPPVISRRHIRKILTWEGPEGLQGALSDIQPRDADMPVSDQGILYDMDTPEEYQWMARRVIDLDIPTKEECTALIESFFCVPKEIQKHCVAVAGTAVLIGDELQKNGCRLNKNLIAAAALLHDAARGKPHHAKVGADQLGQMGFDRVADVVAVHMDYVFHHTDVIDEAAVVFLADKLVQGDRPANIAKRFNEKMKRCADSPKAIDAIGQRLFQVSAVKQAVEKRIGITVEKLVHREYGLYKKEEFIDDLFNAAW